MIKFIILISFLSTFAWAEEKPTHSKIDLPSINDEVDVPSVKPEIEIEGQMDVVEPSPSNTHYSRTKKIKHPLSAKGLSRITKKNEYIYEVKRSPHNHSSTVLLSTFAPTNFIGNSDANGSSYAFEDIYSSGIMLTADYEWKIFKSSMGHFGIKFASGLFLANGNGIFKRDGTTSLEELSFVLLPNVATGTWRLKFWDKQWLVPYAEAGAGYYTFMEFMKNEGSAKFGGAPVVVGAGGIMLDLSLFSRDAVITLDRDYGINGMLFTMEYRMVQGAGGSFDLSHRNLSAGFTLQY